MLLTGIRGSHDTCKLSEKAKAREARPWKRHPDDEELSVH
jgi:hypothetical protein